MMAEAAEVQACLDDDNALDPDRRETVEAPHHRGRVRATVVVRGASEGQLPERLVAALAEQTRSPSRIVQGTLAQPFGRRAVCGATTPAKPGAVSPREPGEDVLVLLDVSYVPDAVWLERMVRPFEEDPTVGVVGGRIDDGEGESAWLDDGQIGMLRPDGTLTYGFATNPGRRVRVDHVSPRSLAVRRTALEQVGGLRPWSEDAAELALTDAVLRVNRWGWRVMFEPGAVVRSTRTAQPRHDPLMASDYASQANHMILLGSVAGVTDGIVRNYLARVGRESAARLVRAVRRPTTDASACARARALVMASAESTEMVAGVLAGLAKAAAAPRSLEIRGRRAR